MIPNLLQARFTGTKRTRDAYYDDKSLPHNDDPGNYGDENYAISFRLTPTDNIEINSRTNERSYRRRMGGADAAGILRLDENGHEGVRDTQLYAFGFRAVDPAVPCPHAFTRPAVVPMAGLNPGNPGNGGVGCTVAGMPTFNFTNPVTHTPVTAQRVVPGVDSSGDLAAGAVNHPNRTFGANPSNQRLIGFDNLTSKDLET